MFESKKVKALRAQIRAEQLHNECVLAGFRAMLYEEQDRVVALEDEVSQLRARINRLTEVAQ